MTKTPDRTKTTPEIAKQIKVQAAQAGMSITSYMKMTVDNARDSKVQTLNIDCKSIKELEDILKAVNNNENIVININNYTSGRE